MKVFSFFDVVKPNVKYIYFLSDFGPNFLKILNSLIVHVSELFQTDKISCLILGSGLEGGSVLRENPSTTCRRWTCDGYTFPPTTPRD